MPLPHQVRSDMQLFSASDVSQKLAFRSSDVTHMRTKHLAFGQASLRADIRISPDARKGLGKGYARWLQHATSCPLAMLGPENRDGRAFSVPWALEASCEISSRTWK